MGFDLLLIIVARYATDVIRECAEAWERLITGKTDAGGVRLYE